jgi:predicted dehydrogenase
MGRAGAGRGPARPAAPARDGGPLSVAVIGCGAWGANYVRVFAELPGARVAAVCDPDARRLAAVRERVPDAAALSDWRQALRRPDIAAVVVASPAATHATVTTAALRAGKHALVEKPLATSVRSAQALQRAARRSGRVLMVGHTFLYNPGIRALRELVRSGALGKLYYLHSTRTNLGPIRPDVNALWDLVAHDVAIFNYLLASRPSWVSAVGAKVLGNGRYDVGFATLGYPSGLVANAHASWLDPNKEREVVVVGSRARAVFDDLNNVERLRIFEKGVAPDARRAGSYGEFRLLVRDGAIVSPRIEPSEPLRNLAQDFLDCVRRGARPLSDGAGGVEVVRALAAMDRSLARRGAPVRLARGEGRDVRARARAGGG